MRRSLTALLLALALLPSLAGAPAAVADVDDDVPVHAEWGRTAAASATLHHGCRRYEYSYAITPPDGDWSLETFLIGPGGKEYGSGYFLTGTDPLAGTSAFRLCLRSTRAGTYTIRALLSVQNGGEYAEGRLPDTTFRLRKPHRH